MLLLLILLPLCWFGISLVLIQIEEDATQPEDSEMGLGRRDTDSSKPSELQPTTKGASGATLHLFITPPLHHSTSSLHLIKNLITWTPYDKLLIERKYEKNKRACKKQEARNLCAHRGVANPNYVLIIFSYIPFSSKSLETCWC